MTAPTVSVVMGVYNDAERVGASVRGILAQTFRDFELVVVDDGSTDGTREVLDRLAITDPRVVLLSKPNGGLTKALIAGCTMARGEFIARQDSDDYSLPTRLEKLVALLSTNASLGFVSSGTEYVGPADEYLFSITRTTDPQIATQRLLFDREGPPAHGSVMFRRTLYEQVGGYRPQFYYSQDSDLWLRMAEVSQIGYVDEVLYRHRKESGSISGARRSVQSQFAGIAHACRATRLAGRSEAELLDEARQLCDATIESIGMQRADSEPDRHAINYMIGSQLAQNGDPRARAYLLRVLKTRPTHARAWIRLIQATFWRLMSLRTKRGPQEG